MATTVLRARIEEWLDAHPDATAREAIWAGAMIEIELWCSRRKSLTELDEWKTTKQ